MYNVDVGRQLLTIFLECADFGNLAEFQSTPSHGKITWSQRKKLCLDVAAGLSMLHDCGMFHGDLKPENVLIFCGPTPGMLKKMGFAQNCVTLAARRFWWRMSPMSRTFARDTTVLLNSSLELPTILPRLVSCVEACIGITL